LYEWQGRALTLTKIANMTDVAARLREHIANPSDFGAVTARVLLRTGVNLRFPRPEQLNDGVLVSRVCDALAEMGYRLRGSPGTPATSSSSTSPGDR
jgi:hypothetical protein